MRKLLYIVGCLLLLSSSPVLAQGEPEMAVVRIDLPARRIVITRGERKSEVTEFSLRMGAEKSAIDVNELYYTTLKKLQQEGYVLKERLDANPGINTYLFVKAPKP
ncbi:hypothetical protein HNQ93_001433 [Hymenobacter luteus]|uniref:Uncharacterized protein n=2 Tax=Hymenobacter TaxID=89966 RepID=A0A7W9SZ48_9BACT|nr:MULTISPECIES: hypothetical protein [Hymenobacter]MBB4601206.1 hypothetical protein [Hymenobacter latericoloratus]MBB6058587.1 hypothetical protein [Hymenobacter luteus]